MVEKSPVDPKTFTTDYVRSDYADMTFMGNAHIDALTSALQALGAEVWSSRRRLYVIEALMAKKMAVTPASIQAYAPTAEERAAWKADRDRMISGIYAPFLRGGELSFPSPEAGAYDPHKAPDLARQAPSGIEADGTAKVGPSPANVAGPMTPAR